MSFETGQRDRGRGRRGGGGCSRGRGSGEASGTHGNQREKSGLRKQYDRFMRERPGAWSVTADFRDQAANDWGDRRPFNREWCCFRGRDPCDEDWRDVGSTSYRGDYFSARTDEGDFRGRGGFKRGRSGGWRGRESDGRGRGADVRGPDEDRRSRHTSEEEWRSEGESKLSYGEKLGRSGDLTLRHGHGRRIDEDLREDREENGRQRNERGRGQSGRGRGRFGRGRNGDWRGRGGGEKRRTHFRGSEDRNEEQDMPNQACETEEGEPREEEILEHYVSDTDENSEHRDARKKDTTGWPKNEKREKTMDSNIESCGDDGDISSAPEVLSGQTRRGRNGETPRYERRMKTVQSKSPGGEACRNRMLEMESIQDIDDSADFINKLISNLESFADDLASESVSPDDSKMLLAIFSKVVTITDQRESVMEFIQMICKSRFLDNHLPILVRRLTTSPDDESIDNDDAYSNVIDVVEKIHLLVRNICQMLPSYASKCALLLNYLHQVTKVMSIVRDNKPSLEEDLKDLEDECERCTGMVQNQQRFVASRRQGPNDDDEIPPEDFAKLPIIPEDRDINRNRKHFLRANKESGAFKDQDHYMDVQFRLMREDYIRPLREGLWELKKMGARRAKKCLDLKLYYGVRIQDVILGETLEHRIVFDVSRFVRVKWKHSKRLPYGRLLCLSNDNFKTLYFAMVTNREPKDLEKGELQVRFENYVDSIMQMSPNDVFTMAETPTFFEAYRHVLEAFQQMKTHPLPMAQYIVHCQKDVKPPKYLRDPDHARLNLKCLLRRNSSFDAASLSVLQPGEWPPLEETCFDSSQLEAMQTALTKELAIIQGPPGTGKTYVGLKVAQVLLENRKTWSDPKEKKPILVVCYTNHALDQFLGGILKFCPRGIVRIGGGCKNAELGRFNLKEIKRQVGKSDEIRESRETMEEIEKSIKMYWAQADGIENRQPLDLKHLKECMVPGQFESLLNFGEDVSLASTKDWLACGEMMWRQEGDTDPYMLLEREVKSHILGGNETCSENDIRPEDVHKLPFGVRAKLYRFWRTKFLEQKGRFMDAPNTQFHAMADREILSDEMLRSVVDQKLFKAITTHLLKKHQKEREFCIRAWLGVQETSQEVEIAIIKGDATFTEDVIQPSFVMSLPRKIRVQLYRSWLKNYVKLLRQQLEEGKKKGGRKSTWEQRNIEAAQNNILRDGDLKTVVRQDLFLAIQRQMLSRHHRQSQRMIRAWLGIAEFARDPQVLENVLDRLLGNVEDTELEVEKEGNGDVTQDSDKTPFQTLGKEKPKPKPLGMNDEWTIPDYVRNMRLTQVENVLRSASPMQEREAKSIRNLCDRTITLTDRVRLYLFWAERYLPRLRKYLLTAREDCEQQSRYHQNLKTKEDIKVLKEHASVIGMTTTGAARYREVLEAVGCPIVIIEEAAEVLEAHVVTTLHKSCQHLILIGDHQQLRPSPTVYELSRKYHLDVSLFERLVNNKLPHSTLAVQHRMRPEISRLVRHVYPHLEDHEVTLNRPYIRGMMEDVFLFHHEVQEQTHLETDSKYNEYEADMVLKLCQYLLLQDYEPRNITVLVAYTGQLLKLKNVMQDVKFKGVYVTAVDNYQGEENDVIILSLVRSNEEGTVGFLGTDNRVCVALSRAKNGLYAFGNFKILAERSKLWMSVVATAKECGQLGEAIVLRCVNHPDTLIHATTPIDFDGAPEGGCLLPCDFMLDCGHVCQRLCHGNDRDHAKYKCMKACERRICKKDLHPCPDKCHEICSICLVKVEKTFPDCGHTAMIECGVDPKEKICAHQCEEMLQCGHQCSKKCGECLRDKLHTKACPVVVERHWPCGHLVKFPCHIGPKDKPCYVACEADLACGHNCPGTCGLCLGGRVHVPCVKTCGKMLPGCGHKCRLPCGSKCLPCKLPCSNACKHGGCDRQCGEPCAPCEEKCQKRCFHKLCEAICDRPCEPCHRPCTRRLDCEHSCRGFCGEKCVCYPCNEEFFVQLQGGVVVTASDKTKAKTSAINRSTRLIKLPRCGHVFDVKALDVYVEEKLKILPPGAILPCPACSRPILDWHCWRYCARFRQRHFAMQAVKKKLIDTTSVSGDRRQKVELSVRMLPEIAGGWRKCAIPEVLDVDLAFALTNQCKLLRVTDSVNRLLLSFLKDSPESRTMHQLSDLMKVVAQPMTFMTTQRCRELTCETHRLTYVVLLRCARQLVVGAEAATGPATDEEAGSCSRSASAGEESWKAATACTGKSEDLPDNEDGEFEDFGESFDGFEDERVNLEDQALQEQIQNMQNQNLPALDESLEESVQSFEEPEQNFEDAVQCLEDTEQSLEDQEQSFEDTKQSLEYREQSFEDAEQSLGDQEQSFEDAEQSLEDQEQSFEDQEQSLCEPEENIHEAKQWREQDLQESNENKTGPDQELNEPERKVEYGREQDLYGSAQKHLEQNQDPQNLRESARGEDYCVKERDPKPEESAQNIRLKVEQSLQKPEPCTQALEENPRESEQSSREDSRGPPEQTQAKGDSETLSRRIDRYLQLLEEKSLAQFPTKEIEKIFAECKQFSDRWEKDVATAVNLKILDAPFHKNLSEIEESPEEPERTREYAVLALKTTR